MRTQKALINSSVNIIAYIIAFIPNLIVRKAFSTSLGDTLLGLNSLYTNIIGWLSLVEMGVGTAIIFSLYKPYAENDQKRVRAYIGFYGWFYRTAGIIILTIGILITPFLRFFIKDGIDLRIASLGFLLVLFNSFLTYLFSHKLCILNVAQEAYKVTVGTTVSKLVIAFLQVIVLKVYPNFLLFISIQIIVNLVYYIWINLYIAKRYSWLSNGKEQLEKKERNSLLKNVRAMFMHKIGALVVNSTDNIVISSFVGLSSLAKYTNYQIIISSLQIVVSTGLNGLTASLGNMLIDDDKSKAYKVHKKVFFLNFWVVSFIAISLYNTLNQFVGLWMGPDSLLDSLTFKVILINLYFAAMRGSVEQFQTASGNFYQDRYAAFAESAINLVCSIVLVNYIGIAGVFIGTLISNFTVIFWTKPYVVYKYVFNVKLIEYFKMYLKYLIIAIIPLLISNYLTIPFKAEFNFVSFLINCIINIIIINLIYIIIFFKTDEFKYYTELVKKIIKR